MLIRKAKQSRHGTYLTAQMQRLQIVIPKQAAPFLPKLILQLSGDVRKSQKR